MTLTAPMLKVIEEAGEAVLVLTDGLPREDLVRSRLTRAEVQRQLVFLADTLEGASPALREHLPEIEWDGWRTVQRSLQAVGGDSASAEAANEALWFAVQSLVPATLGWLRVARQAQPQLFTQWC